MKGSATPSLRSDPTDDRPAVTDYCFADFRLSARQQSLFRAGEPQQLTTKIYYLLMAFVERPGEVLSKDAIVEAVWPGQVVTDTALAKQVLRLRRILDDAARDTPLIETHRGVGYRLTCPVETVHEQPTVDTASPSRSTRARSVSLFAAAACLALGMALIALYSSSDASGGKDPTTPDAPLALLPVAGNTPTLSRAAAEYIAMRLGGGAALAPASLPGEDDGDTAAQSLRLKRLASVPRATALKLSQSADGFLLDLTARGRSGAPHHAQLSGQTLAETIEAGVAWLTAQDTHRATEPSTTDTPGAASRDAYALDSYLRGLLALHGTGSRERAAEYFRAAISSDGGFLHAHLRLAEAESMLGRQYEAIATATALLARPDLMALPDLALDARLIAAKAYRALGDNSRAREQLVLAQDLLDSGSSPYRRLSALAALALMAQLDRDYPKAQALGLQRLALARDIFPLPSFIAGIHLELASYLDQTGEPEKLREHAEAARSLAEEAGDAELLISSYRYLSSQYFSGNDIDSAVQLAVAAQPFLDRVAASEDKAYFLQFSAMALNLRGLFDLGMDYTRRLRASGKVAGNPIYGAIADFTVMHRLYVQGAFEEARAMAASTRARFATDAVTRVAVPRALAFEAVVAARSALPEDALALLAEFEEQHPDYLSALEQTLLRARGHLAVRQGNIDSGLDLLRQSEAMHRQQGHHSVAAFVAYEIVEIRLNHETVTPWDDLERLGAQTPFDYHLARLQALAHARDGNFLAAATALENSRLRSNDLWSPEDELLLERYRSAMAMRDAVGSDPAGT